MLGRQVIFTKPSHLTGPQPGLVGKLGCYFSNPDLSSLVSSERWLTPLETIASCHCYLTDTASKGDRAWESQGEERKSSGEVLPHGPKGTFSAWGPPREPSGISWSLLSSKQQSSVDWLFQSSFWYVTIQWEEHEEQTARLLFRSLYINRGHTQADV